jgi:hypothetical protein
MVQNRAEVEDLTQETFIRVHRSLPTFRGEASLSTMSLESHLSGCPDCRLQAANLQSSPNRLQMTFPDQVPPAELWNKIQARIKAK